MDTHFCRVCGLFIENFPWGKDGKSPTYEICACCGVEFGNEDYTIKSVKEYRDKWVQLGFNWFDINEKPGDWDLDKQMKNIPGEFK